MSISRNLQQDITNFSAIREAFGLMGIDTIPLQPNSKVCSLPGWNKREPERLWRNAPPDANLGVRCGGVNSFCVLDADEKNQPGTVANVERWLNGLGVDRVCTVQTASGVGRHYYFSLDGVLPGEYSLLKPDFGAGEFRFGSGAYVVGPPSVIDGKQYEFLEGTPEWINILTLADVLPILSRDVTQTSLQKFEPTIPRNIVRWLHGNEGSADRSRDSQSALTSLINAGFDFDGVLALFLKYPCDGKFSELHQANHKRGVAWLKHSYDSAQEYVARHPESATRKALADIQAWATNTAWTGRTGAYDRAVFLAHVQKAHQAGQFTYGASCRNLAELAGVSKDTVSNANKRLEKMKLLKFQEPGVWDNATKYTISASGQTYTLPNYLCEVLSDFVQHDLFRRSGGLGKSCAEVYSVLQAQPASVQELSERTGRHEKTVKRNLAKMARITNDLTGELVQLVEQDGDNWRSCPDASLDAAAVVLGCAGAGARQRMKHLQERQAHRRLLRSYQAKQEVTK